MQFLFLCIGSWAFVWRKEAMRFVWKRCRPAIIRGTAGRLMQLGKYVAAVPFAAF